MLDQRGIVVVPDILANAGGVTASYFEWVQSRQGMAWEEDEVARLLRRYMDDAFTAVWARSQALGVSMRRGAFALAHLDDDMRAAREGRQQAAVRRAEVEARDELVDRDDVGDGDIELGGAGAHRKTSSTGTCSLWSSALMQTPWKAARRRE